MTQELDEEAMKSLLKWIDSVPLSRPKKNLARDFSDGVLAAEVIKVTPPIQKYLSGRPTRAFSIISLGSLRLTTTKQPIPALKS